MLFRSGHAGALGDFSLRPGTNTSDTAAVRRPHPKATTFVSPGTDIIMDLPGGGGIGDPRDRDPAHVAADVRDGYVSPESSLHVYARQP